MRGKKEAELIDGGNDYHVYANQVIKYTMRVVSRAAHV